MKIASPRLHLSHKGKVDIKRLIGVVSFISSSKSCYNKRQYIFYRKKIKLIMNNVCGNIIGLISAHYKPVTYILNHLGLFLNLLYFLRQGYVHCENIFNVLPHLFGLLALEQGEGGRWRIHYDLGNDRKISAISFLSPSQPHKLSLFFIKNISTGNNFHATALIFLFSFPLAPPYQLVTV